MSNRRPPQARLRSIKSVASLSTAGSSESQWVRLRSYAAACRSPRAGVSGNLRRSCARRLAQRQRTRQPGHHPRAVIAALKDAGYLHIPEGRRDATTPAEPSAATASISTEADIHGTRRSPGRVGGPQEVSTDPQAHVPCRHLARTAIGRAGTTIGRFPPGVSIAGEIVRVETPVIGQRRAATPAQQGRTPGGHDHGGMSPRAWRTNPKRHVHAGRSRELAMIMGVVYLGGGGTNPRPSRPGPLV
jgi:hypothetical protein